MINVGRRNKYFRENIGFQLRHPLSGRPTIGRPQQQQWAIVVSWRAYDPRVVSHCHVTVHCRPPERNSTSVPLLANRNKTREHRWFINSGHIYPSQHLQHKQYSKFGITQTIVSFFGIWVHHSYLPLRWFFAIFSSSSAWRSPSSWGMDPIEANFERSIQTAQIKSMLTLDMWCTTVYIPQTHPTSAVDELHPAHCEVASNITEDHR